MYQFLKRGVSGLNLLNLGSTRLGYFGFDVSVVAVVVVVLAAAVVVF